MKTVMVLINGFGVESKDSYSIYDKNLVPNIDGLTKTYMFGPLSSNVNDYRDGYRNLSLGINEMYNYSIFEENANIITSNQVLVNMKNELETRKSKLHIFCFIDKSEKLVDQIKLIVKNINPEEKQKIFLHIVLTSNNINDYKDILKVLSKINMDISDYAKIGMVMGLATLSNSSPITESNFFFRMFISEIGEKWQSFSQKLDVCYGIKQIPNLVKPFVVNNGFSLDKNDLFMIWNYDKIDLTNFINITRGIKYGEESNTFKFFSLFEIKAQEKVDFMLTYHPSSKSIASNLKGLGAKAMIIAKKDQINSINYYVNGLQTVVNENINYIEADNYLFKPKELLGIINNYDHELMIINYDIESATTIEELKQLLHNIDIMIGNIYENSKINKYSIIISSLYGINKIFKNNKGEICNVIFNNKLPFVFINDFITKKNYLIEDGSITDLMGVCYMSMDKGYMGHSIVTKKNALYRLIFK